MLNLIATKTVSKFFELKNDERGASAIEYAVIAAIVVVVIIAGINLLGLGNIFTNVEGDIGTLND